MRFSTSYKCDYCTGRINRGDVEKKLQAPGSLRKETVEMDRNKQARGVLDRVSIHPKHYCRIVVKVNLVTYKISTRKVFFVCYIQSFMKSFLEKEIEYVYLKDGVFVSERIKGTVSF